VRSLNLKVVDQHGLIGVSALLDGQDRCAVIADDPVARLQRAQPSPSITDHPHGMIRSCTQAGDTNPPMDGQGQQQVLRKRLCHIGCVVADPQAGHHHLARCPGQRIGEVVDARAVSDHHIGADLQRVFRERAADKLALRTIWPVFLPLFDDVRARYDLGRETASHQNFGSITKRWIHRMVPTGDFSHVCVRRDGDDQAWLAFGGHVS
jgi:hypothetical protein